MIKKFFYGAMIAGMMSVGTANAATVGACGAASNNVTSASDCRDLSSINPSSLNATFVDRVNDLDVPLFGFDDWILGARKTSNGNTSNQFELFEGIFIGSSSIINGGSFTLVSDFWEQFDTAALVIRNGNGNNERVFAYNLVSDIITGTWSKFDGPVNIVGLLVRERSLDDGVGSNPGGDFDPITPVPLPAAAWMLIAALGGIGLLGRKRKMQA